MTAPDHSEADQWKARMETDQSVVEDLRQRLQSSQEQETAARAALRVATRELALMRRLSKFFATGASRVAAKKHTAIPRGPAALLTGGMVHHLDLCEPRGEYTVISGWAFHPNPAWDARDMTVTLLFQNGATAYYAVAGRTQRPDVAAHFAAQTTDAAGGARGLDSVGFMCEVLSDSLPAGRDWQIALRLVCGNQVCEGPTGGRLSR